MPDKEILDEASGLIIRTASNTDGERICELVFGVLREFDLESDLSSTDSDLIDIEGSYVGRGGIFEVIESQDGSLLGTYGLYPVDNSTIELRKMYFSDALRGRGLGRKVLQRAVDKARRLGYSTIYLETAAVLKTAIKLYRSFGFRPVDVVHSKRCDQGFVLDLSQK